MRDCNEHEITVEKLLNIVHSSTERIAIYVVIGDAWQYFDKFPNKNFYLTENLSGSPEEKNRVLKYYADVPVWNVHVGFDAAPVDKGHAVVACIVANCHFRDMGERYFEEKADLQKARRKAQREKRQERLRKEQK